MHSEPFPLRRRVRTRLSKSAYEHGGRFFVTLCADDRRPLFGDVLGGEMRVNAAGAMVEATWRELPVFTPGVTLDAFQMMPNHLHGLLVIAGSRSGAIPSLPEVVQRFKSLTTRRYIAGVNERGWARFDGRLWQRGYYDTVVRNDASFERIRSYIAANPANWATDPENPRGP
jgi:putative transposase